MINFNLKETTYQYGGASPPPPFARTYELHEKVFGSNPIKPFFTIEGLCIALSRNVCATR